MSLGILSMRPQPLDRLSWGPLHPCGSFEMGLHFVGGKGNHANRVRGNIAEWVHRETDRISSLTKTELFDLILGVYCGRRPLSVLYSWRSRGKTAIVAMSLTATQEEALGAAILARLEDLDRTPEEPAQDAGVH